MNDPSTDQQPRRRRRAAKLPLRIVSDISPDTPVTQAEIDLIIAMLGGPEGMQRILEGRWTPPVRRPVSDPSGTAEEGMQKTPPSAGLGKPRKSGTPTRRSSYAETT